MKFDEQKIKEIQLFFERIIVSHDSRLLEKLVDQYLDRLDHIIYSQGFSDELPEKISGQDVLIKDLLFIEQALSSSFETTDLVDALLAKSIGNLKIPLSDYIRTHNNDDTSTIVLDRRAEDLSRKEYNKGKIPHILGDYLIENELDSGGRGIVYLATQMSLNRRVALKVIREGIDASIEDILRFKSEAENIARLKHSNIVRIFDMNEMNGIYYFAMEYIEGMTLRSYLNKRNETTLNKLLHILISIANAIEYTHSRGIIHGDIKPENVIIDKDLNPKILDFGISMKISSTELTSTIMGTPQYMSPEQLRNDLVKIDERSDVYSLGVLMYEMLTGKLPFVGNDVDEIIAHVLKDEPGSFKEGDRFIHRDLQTICLKAMDKNIERRYRDVASFAEDIERYLSGDPIRAHPPNILYILNRRIHKNRTLLILLSVCFVAIITSVILFIVYRDVLKRQAEMEHSSWELVFEDDFNRESLGNEWRVMQYPDDVYIKDSCLFTDYDNQSIMLMKRFPGDVRLEYDAWVDTSSKYICDISCFLSGDSVFAYITGYYMGFGDNYNYRSYLMRSNEKVIVNNKARIKGKGVKHHIVAERLDKWVRLYVDGSLMYEFYDIYPIQSEENVYLGLYKYNSRVCYDNVKVYSRSVPEKIDIVNVADRLYLNKDYYQASLIYKEILKNTRNSEREWIEFKYLQAIRFLFINDHFEVTDMSYYEQFSEKVEKLIHSDNEILRINSRLLKSYMLISEGRIKDATRIIRNEIKRTQTDYLRYQISKNCIDIGKRLYSKGDFLSAKKILYLIPKEIYSDLPYFGIEVPLIAYFSGDKDKAFEIAQYCYENTNIASGDNLLWFGILGKFYLMENDTVALNKIVEETSEKYVHYEYLMESYVRTLNEIYSLNPQYFADNKIISELNINEADIDRAGFGDYLLYRMFLVSEEELYNDVVEIGKNINNTSFYYYINFAMIAGYYDIHERFIPLFDNYHSLHSQCYYAFLYLYGAGEVEQVYNIIHRESLEKDRHVHFTGLIFASYGNLNILSNFLLGKIDDEDFFKITSEGGWWPSTQNVFWKAFKYDLQSSRANDDISRQYYEDQAAMTYREYIENSEIIELPFRHFAEQAIKRLYGLESSQQRNM